MTEKNRKSDFKIIEVLPDDSYNGIPFEYTYFTKQYGKKYIAAFDGNTYTNCKKTEGGDLLILFNSPGFEPGRLMCEKKYMIPDEDMPDGTYDIVTKVAIDIKITEGSNSDDEEFLIYLPELAKQGEKGDPGEPLTWEDLTEEQRAELTENDIDGGTLNN